MIQKTLSALVLGGIALAGAAVLGTAQIERLDLNQMVLAGLGVSTEELERMCAVAREHGALGAKLTGAGGGGCMIALVDGQEGLVKRALEDAGFAAFVTTVGADA